MAEIRDQLQEVFRELFEDDNLVLRDEMTADDIPGWDSLMHVNIVIAVEQRMGIRFATAEISSLKNPGKNIGNFVELIRKKLKS